jgi:hypothetical protein
MRREEKGREEGKRGRSALISLSTVSTLSLSLPGFVGVWNPQPRIENEKRREEKRREEGPS